MRNMSARKCYTIVKNMYSYKYITKLDNNVFIKGDAIRAYRI